MAGDVGLERELVQQPLAEGVDGLDLQPARRLQGAREEPAGPASSRGVGRRPSIVGELAGELGIGQRRPVGEAFEDALRHLAPPPPW